MFKKSFLAVAILSFCAASVFAQPTEQVFVTFGEGANVSSTSTVFIGDGSSGSAFIYSAADFQYQAFDLEFSTTDNSVIQFTGAELFEPINELGQFRWDDFSQLRPLVEPANGQLRAVAVTVMATGIVPALGAGGLDPEFDFEANAFRVARIDYDIVGVGTADISLALGVNKFFSVASRDVLIQPTLGNGTLTVTGVPEPGSATLIALVLVGVNARRRRVSC